MYIVTTTHLTILYNISYISNSLAKNLVGHNAKLVGRVPQCAPPWLRHWVIAMKEIIIILLCYTVVVSYARVVN